MATGVIEADAIATALQPLNVQMAILIEAIKGLKGQGARASAPVSGTPVAKADAMVTALQPLNVQMAILIEAVRALKGTPFKDGGKDKDDDEPAKKRAAASWNDITRGLGASVVVLNQMNSLIGSFGAQVGSLVSAFSPATLELFTRAVKDLHASVGEQLLPIFRAGTDVVRFLADSVAGLTPQILPLVNLLVQNLKPVITILGDGLRTLLVAMIPVMKAFGEIQTQIFAALTPILAAIIPAVVAVVGIIQRFQIVVGQVLVAALTAVAPVIQTLAETLLPVLVAGLEIMATAVKVLLAPLQIGAVLLGGLFQVLTYPLRLLGPVLATVAKAIGEVVDLLGGLFADVMHAVADLLKDLFGIIAELLAPVGNILTGVIRGIVSAMVDAVKWFRDLIIEIRAFLGLPELDGAKVDFDGASRNKGASAASTTTVSEMLKQLDAAAFGAGKAAPAEETAKNTAASLGLLGEMRDLLRDLPDRIGSAIKGALPSLPNAPTAQSVTSTIAPIANTLSPVLGARQLLARVLG